MKTGLNDKIRTKITNETLRQLLTCTDVTFLTKKYNSGETLTDSHFW